MRDLYSLRFMFSLALKVNNMKYKAIIFDMDGTIINSEHRWHEAMVHLLKSKANLTDEQANKIVSQFKGASSYTSCEFLKKAYNPKESIEELIKEKDAFVFKNFAKLVTLIEGFENFHKKLVSCGLKSAIATNAHQSSLDRIKECIPLKTFFNEHIYCIDQVEKKAKPLPDIYLYAAKKIETDPEYCIAIEDSVHGVAAAKAAGMFCVGINTGKDRSALKLADLIVEHYDEIDMNLLLVRKKNKK